MKVLIVDDNPRIRQLVRSFLPLTVDEVFECSDGNKALGLYEQHHPDWVLMDWEMPEIDGITATREIIAKFPTAHICMVTAYDFGDLKKRAFSAGASDFVVKDNLHELKTILVSELEH